jgi:hypothetical protein
MGFLVKQVTTKNGKRERDRERTRKVTSIILALSHDFLQVGNKVVISTALSLIEI